ncbi:MAG: hypothetical protein ACJZ5B_08985 [Candidatus Poseidoniaceae archaeon]
MVEIVVRRLNKAGNEAFAEEVKRVKNAGAGTVFDASKILKEEFYEQFEEGKVKFENLTSGKKRAEISEILYKAFSDAGLKVSDYLDDIGLWNFLMARLGSAQHLAYEGDKLKDLDKYVHNGNGYRHHLANITWAEEKIQTCGFGKLMLIASKKSKTGQTQHEREMQFGEIQEQVVQGHILRSDACFELVEKLFYDEDKKYWKPGIASNKRPDSLRKLKKFLYKLDSLYDVYSMTCEELLSKVENDGRFNKRLIKSVNDKWE